MSLPRLKSAVRQAVGTALAVAMSIPGWAQDASSVPSAPQPQQQQFVLKDYSKGASHFPNPIGPYRGRSVDAISVANSSRIYSLIKDGKLMLSMEDAIALALENNLDIAIQRYNLNIADTDILKAKSGALITGVNAGVLQGTPGGGVGGLGGQIGSGAGGTNAGGGGAGAGVSGLVGSTLGDGPFISSFDPILSGTLQFDHNNFLSASSFADPVTSANSTVANFSYLQGFVTGTNLAVGFNNQRSTTSSGFDVLSPNLTSSFQARVTQHLLQGFGFAPNNRFIRIAKNNREVTDVAFRLQLITTIDQIENMYWDLVFAYENVRVQEESLAFASKTLSDTRKQVEIGTLAPIEVVRAQSTVASDQQTLTVARTNLELQQLLMKNALTRSMTDPILVDAQVIPTSVTVLPSQEEIAPTQDLINDAFSHRPELASERITLANIEISNKAIRSSLLPSLDLFAYYGGSGQGGSQNAANLCDPTLPPDQQPNPFCNDTAVSPKSYGSTLNQLVNGTAPDKGVGLTLNIPLRNRSAQATQIRSQLELRQTQLRLQQIENQVRIEVRNAQFAVQQNRASVDSARAAVELAHQSLDAEQKKYSLGASTSTLVLQNQSALATAESTQVSAMAAYAKARLELDRATGLLLDRRGIILADAERGQVTRNPTVQYVTPRTEPITTTPPPPPADQPQPPPQN